MYMQRCPIRCGLRRSRTGVVIGRRWFTWCILTRFGRNVISPLFDYYISQPWPRDITDPDALAACVFLSVYVYINRISREGVRRRCLRYVCCHSLYLWSIFVTILNGTYGIGFYVSRALFDRFYSCPHTECAAECANIMRPEDGLAIGNSHRWWDFNMRTKCRQVFRGRAGIEPKRLALQRTFISIFMIERCVNMRPH